MGRFIDFVALKAEVPFADAIDALKLKMKFAGNQWRGPCPACGGGMLVITKGVAFHCKLSDEGGDQIALTKHVLGLSTMRDAAFELADRARSTGTSNSKSTSRQVPSRTVPESEREPAPSRPRGEGPKNPSPQPSRQSFDPESFWAKTAYTDEVADLGITEDQAEALGIGFYRGKLYQALRYANGQVAGFSAFANGELKLPSNLLPMSNVVPLQKRA